VTVGHEVTADDWPALPYDAWHATRDTLHMYLQVIGKVRLALSPMEPQWAQVPLYVTARGLNTSPIPHPAGVFDVDVDLVDHVVTVRTARGAVRRVGLEPRSVAEFYRELMEALARADVPVEITTVPQEVPEPIPFPDDTTHASYEPEWANRFWRALVSVDAVMKEHRARFRGKTSPVQLFWGALDLSYMRFSGRVAAPPPGADVIARYSADAEHVCAGFWPGDGRLPEPAFFAYASPAPAGVQEAGIEPAEARWDAELGEFLLPYEFVRTASEPRVALRAFLETTYRAGARLGEWDTALSPEPDAAATRDR
jgi:hypothetical protein